MDPLSAAATIAGVATAAFQIISYLGTVAAGGKERLSLLNEVTHLWLTITALQAQIDGEGSIGERKLFHPQLLSLFAADGVIKDIETLVLDLDTQLKSRSTHGKVRQTLAWPFTQKDVLQTVEQLHRLQQTLQFALAQSNHSLTQAIYQDTQAVKAVIDETQMKEMIEWLSPLNFVAKQHLLFKEHHEGTCKWFLDCDDFREWREGENAMLFCPGIPGAGKTFLSSIVINELDRLRLGEEGGLKDAAILMLYCKWDDSLSQSIDALVASLLKQIAQRYGTASGKMVEMFSQYSRAGTKPGREEMISVLGTELARFPKAFIIVDGLDELRDEKSRLALLDTLGSTSAKVNLMITSRPLNNIVQHFQDQGYYITCDGCGRRDQPYQHHCSECYNFHLSIMC
jgi:ankyrin repeat domain-containing protein 50